MRLHELFDEDILNSKRKRQADLLIDEPVDVGEDFLSDKIEMLGDEELLGILYDNEPLEEAEYQGKKVTLNKPFRTQGGKRKFAVYVKDGDKIKKVSFGDPNMEIRRDDPEARKSFRARHKCDQKKDKTTAGYWSCKMWQNSKSVGDMLG